jgi:hypothetical protein
MGLSATRNVKSQLKDFPAAADFGTSLQDVTLEQDIYDHPYPKLSLVLHQVRNATDINGNVISRTEEWWEYDELSRAKVSYSKDVYAWGYVPGITNQAALVLVEQERTLYTVKSYYLGGPDAGRVTTRRGYVVYDQMPAGKTLTSAQQDKLRQLGRRVPGGGVLTHGEIVDTGRKYEHALSHKRIVYDPAAPQITVWKDPTEIEIVDVVDDWDKVITTTIKKDCIQEGPPTFDRKESHKEPMTASLPVKVEAPVLSATPGAAGIRLEVTKGGGVFTSFLGSALFPTPHDQHLRPDMYIIFRKTTYRPAPATSTDPFGLYVAAPPGSPVGLGKVTDNLAAKNYTGATVDPRPAQVSYTVPEDPTPPTADSWSQIAKLDNAVQDEEKDGEATYTDTAVDTGFAYEYFAVAVVGANQSTDSNHVAATYVGTLTTSMSVSIHSTKSNPAAITIDVKTPSLAGADDTYGRTRVYDPVRAAFASEAAATQFGQDVGQRQFALSDGFKPEVRITPTAILFDLERGMLADIPGIAWETWGNQLHLSSEVVPRTYYLNGFSWTITMGPDGTMAAQVGELIFEEL